MFRLLFETNGKSTTNQSILKNADQLVRRYQIPVHSEKEDVLGTIFSKIKKGESAPQIVTQKISKSTLTAVAVAASIVLLLGLYIFTALETYSGKRVKSLSFAFPTIRGWCCRATVS